MTTAAAAASVAFADAPVVAVRCAVADSEEVPAAGRMSSFRVRCQISHALDSTCFYVRWMIRLVERLRCGSLV